MMKKIFLSSWLVVVSVVAVAQDSSSVLPWSVYLELVFKNHPQMRQSEIAVERAQAALRQARGAFDPKIEGSWSEKVFDGTDYYDLQHYGLKLPTWFGIEGFAGYERVAGTYFNPENRTPADGLWQAGLSVPLGQGLWVDKRRTVLRQAQVMRQASYVEQEQLINDLLLNAGRAYWQWLQHYREYLAYQEAENISREVLGAVRQAYLFGDRAAVDTLEATIQFQNWTQLRVESFVKYQTAGFELETYLWDPQGRPLVMEGRSLPDTSLNTGKPGLVQAPAALSAALDNPAFRLIDYRRQRLQYEQRWQRERLKPDVRVKFYALNEPLRLQEFPFQGQRIGLDFSFPLFLRDARGSLKQVNLQQESLKLEQGQREIGLTNQLAALQLEWEQLLELTSTQRELVGNLETMLSAEQIRFQQGESSIFIINQREAALVSGRLRHIQLQYRLQLNELRQLHLTGKLPTLLR